VDQHWLQPSPQGAITGTPSIARIEGAHTGVR